MDLEVFDMFEVQPTASFRSEVSGWEFADEFLPGDNEDPTLVRGPYYTVFGHYRPCCGRTGREAICDCCTEGDAEKLIKLLQETAKRIRNGNREKENN